MSFEMTKVDYSGEILEVTLGGEGKKQVTIGGESSYPFHLFEGVMPHKPIVAMEVWDMEPEDWPAACREPFADVLGDPAAWAKKCVEEYGADAIVVQLKSTDPNDKDAPPAEASATVGKVLAAVDVPVIIWGSANVQKDAEVLKQIAEDHANQNLLLGPVDEDNHKQIGAAALAYNQSLISSSPIDVNLAKQLNILLGNLGLPMQRTVIDPTTGGLGYGLEYSYSVMERIRMAALVQEDDKLVLPMINNVGNEVWKSKEAKVEGEDSAAMNLGDDAQRGVNMEITAAVAYLLAGSDILILRHPKTVEMIKSFIDKISAERAPAAERVTIEREKAKPIPGFEAKKAAPAAAPAATAKPKPKAAAPAAAKPAAAPAAAPATAAETAAAPAEAPAAAPAAAPDAAAAAAAQAAAEAEAKAKAEAAAAAQAAAEAEAAEAARQARREADLAELSALRQKRREGRLKALAERQEAIKEIEARAAGQEYGPHREEGVAGPEASFVDRSLQRWLLRGDGYLVTRQAKMSAVLKDLPAAAAPAAKPAAGEAARVAEPAPKAAEAAPAEAPPAEAAAPQVAEVFMHTIGENLNVIKTEIGKAFKERNPEPIQKLAQLEKAKGVNWIDINLGPARKGGPELMQWVVQTVQEVVPDVPLALDTSNIEAIEAGLEVHKGTALINSIMARPERYQVMLPLAAKYKADAVALLWGPDGLPRDENERASLCVELVHAANEAGVPNERLFVDPIITPVNIQQTQLMCSLTFMEMLQDIAPGARSTNGLSNISNGTPWREPLNQVFMIMLQRAGMYSSIVDYEDDLLMEIATGGRQDLVEIVHKVQDGEIKDPQEVPEGMARTFVVAAQAILGHFLYSDSWYEIEGGARPE